MWPFEFVAMPTDSPSVSPGGTFNKFGTDVYWISGTFWIVAFCCANAEAAKSARAKTHANAKRHFMGPSGLVSGPPSGSLRYAASIYASRFRARASHAASLVPVGPPTLLTQINPLFRWTESGASIFQCVPSFPLTHLKN